MREYLLVLLVAAGVTYVGASLARRLAFRYNAVALVRDRDVHTTPIPYFGGVAMLAGTTAALILATNLPWLGRFELVQRDAWAVFWASVLICTVGVVDDMFELGAIPKFAGQTLAAGIVVLNGVKFYWIPLPDRIIALDNVAATAVAVFVILVCVNAINFMDGLDGLAAGVVGIGAGAFFVYAYLLSYEQELVRATTASLLTVALVGVCLGFLPHNIHRARMFMGDSGQGDMIVAEALRKEYDDVLDLAMIHDVVGVPDEEKQRQREAPHVGKGGGDAEALFVRVGRELAKSFPHRL